jgi:hypothetical protein
MNSATPSVEESIFLAVIITSIKYGLKTFLVVIIVSDTDWSLERLRLENM